MTPLTDSKVIQLINSSFDADGMIIRKGMRARQKQAIEILASGISYYNQMIDGYDAHGCLLIIANPNKEI